MAIPTKTEAHIARRYQGLAPFLNERQRRLLAGAEASTLGRGAIAAVSRATGLSVKTVKAGREEFNLACQGKVGDHGSAATRSRAAAHCAESGAS